MVRILLINQGQTKSLDTKLSFDLDQLPVSFGRTLRTEDGEFTRGPLNKAMRQLSDIIWKEGGFRFFHWKTRTDPDLVYKYHCSQDESREQKSKSEGKHDVSRMQRFQCQSKLRMRPCLESRTMGLTMFHQHHHSYVNISLSDEVLDFIRARVTSSTASEVYRDLLAAKVHGSRIATQSQVYYQWQQANAATWRRDPDQFVSAVQLLSGGDNSFKEYRSGNLRGLALYIPQTIDKLASSTKEVAMDATFGTNNAGMDLFTILAEYDGSGIPLAYLFVQRMTPESGVGGADPGALPNILCQFLSYLRDRGLKPTFFGTDKDRSEIFAIKQVWPGITVQLCYWHVKRAIRFKLKSTARCKTLLQYHPAEAQKLVPELELCWGSMVIRRPIGCHRNGRCGCASKDVRHDEAGRQETSTAAERDIVLGMVCRHFNSHSLIPDKNGTYRSATVIHQESATEIYRWCRARNYVYLWAYLYTNWYCPGQWELWARSANAEEIPVLKTTMVVESHWRKVKHDYLHRFNRPRIDLVIWILMSRLIPDAVNRMEALVEGNNRQAIASWRKCFKRQWKDLTTREVQIQSIDKYHTNPYKWTCACPAFLESRFLVCKHLLHCHERIEAPIAFFPTIRRHRVSPFWHHEQLVLRPEYALHFASINEVAEGSENMDGGTGEDTDSDSGDELVVEDQASSADDDVESGVDVEGFLGTLKSLTEIVTEQAAMGNTKFLQKTMEAHRGSMTLVEEVNRLRNRRTMASTWALNKHPATMYYR